MPERVQWRAQLAQPPVIRSNRSQETLLRVPRSTAGPLGCWLSLHNQETKETRKLGFEAGSEIPTADHKKLFLACTRLPLED
jgi:hypothetical protein